MLKKIGVDSKVSNKTNDILSATKLILPGVGSFDTGMINIKKKGILSSIEKKRIQVLEEKIVYIKEFLDLRCNSSSVQIPFKKVN